MSIRRSGSPAQISSFVSVGVTVILSLLTWASTAAATALTGVPPQPGAPGLPEGRVYEQVSPTNKFGNEAGITINAEAGGTPPLIFAGTDGNEVFYSSTGSIGETTTGFGLYSVARRSRLGWATRGALPRGVGHQGLFQSEATDIGSSADLSQALFTSNGPYVLGQGSQGARVYIYGEDGTLTWIGRPTIPTSEASDGSAFGKTALVGGSSDYSTVYFSYGGTLVPQDLERNPALGDLSRADLMQTEKPTGSNPGLYEWHSGALGSAAVLPDGHLDPYGAQPAGSLGFTEFTVENTHNQVADEGSRLFFVSPAPGSGSGRPVELYVHETEGDSQRSVLVSRDELLPDSAGLPATAPTGVVTIQDQGQAFSYGNEPFYMSASPDGSRVLFQSTDRLTQAAPNDAGVKQYVFDLETDSLEYLPARIDVKASSDDGSRALVAKLERENSSAVELEFLSGDQSTPIEPMPAGAIVRAARSAADGHVFAFESDAAWPGFNNGAGAFFQIYRYDADSNSLTCVSCPPTGVAPTGDAAFTHAYPSSERFNNDALLSADRGISEDGDRVFFDSPDQVVPQDTDGTRDVYEWQNGEVFLLSTGTSSRESYFGDNSPSGNDVFFSTIDGLAPGDTDNGYDVYDARVPRPGDVLLPSAVPCEGEVCQGPPSVPSLLGLPASATFSGPGNVQPSETNRAVKKTRKGKTKKVTKRKKKRKSKKAGKSADRSAKSDRRVG